MGYLGRKQDLTADAEFAESISVCGPFDFYGLNLGQAGPLLELFRPMFDGGAIPFDFAVYIAIRQIPHPTGEPQGARVGLSEKAKPHPLDASFDADMRGRLLLKGGHAWRNFQIALETSLYSRAAPF